MNSIVIENVKAAELPREWAEQLNAPENASFTVRIEPSASNAGELQAEPGQLMAAFGIWRDREDMTDIAAHVRRIRAPRTFSE